MRLNIVKSKNATSFYVTKTVYIDGKQTSKTVEKLGTLTEITRKIEKGKDPYEWAREYVATLNEQEKQGKREIIARFSPIIQIEKGKRNLYNGGYLFLQKIYHELGLDKICKGIEKKHKFDYDLNEILSRLIYGRILFPSSKKTTYELSQNFFEGAKFDLHQIYRALEVIAIESDVIEERLYKNSLKSTKRNTGILYYDCTNYFFEIEKAGGLKQYGCSKEHRPNPIVQMGLFMDGDGIPLAMSIFEGNKNEQQTLTTVEKRIISDFRLSKFVVCTDAGLASASNRLFNTVADRAFIVTQSLKTMKKHLVDWSLNPIGWHIVSDGRAFNLSELDEEKYIEELFYKERWINENGLQQRLIVSFSFKYRRYQRTIRQAQIERAQKIVDSPSRGKRTASNDCKRFISSTNCTKNGEIADHEIISLNQFMIEKEEKFDGFYGICTNLEDNVSSILKVNQQRWKIEECFRILKTEFRARPVYLSKDNRIKAHFLTCFLSLIVFRFLEKKLAYVASCDEIINTLRNMNFFDVNGEGFAPAYMRTNITDALHDAFGFRTDLQVINNSKLKGIIKMSHSS